MDHQEQDNPELEEVVEESADVAREHGLPRREAEQLEGEDDISPKDGGPM